MKRPIGKGIFIVLFGLLLLFVSSSSFFYAHKTYLATQDIRKEQAKTHFLTREELNNIVLRLCMTKARNQIDSFFDELTKDRLVTEAILSASIMNDTPIMLSFALVWKESQFDPHAVGQNVHSTDYGLWQLNSITFYKLSQKQMFDPMNNCKLGAQYLRSRYDEHLAWEKAILSYNCGGISSVPEATVNYLCDVLKLEEDLSSMFIQRFLS